MTTPRGWFDNSYNGSHFIVIPLILNWDAKRSGRSWCWVCDLTVSCEKLPSCQSWKRWAVYAGAGHWEIQILHQQPNVITYATKSPTLALRGGRSLEAGTGHLVSPWARDFMLWPAAETLASSKNTQMGHLNITGCNSGVRALFERVLLWGFTSSVCSASRSERREEETKTGRLDPQ